ncbi:hypothetical protein H2248_005402 [Termitomyces sp. 'cryptogamus']|nr:hypothetical protein H2248_005402 [Termitomyces sp. 'cryptogamus']
MTEIINEAMNMLPLDADHKIGRAEESDAHKKEYSQSLLHRSNKSAEADSEIERQVLLRQETLMEKQKEMEEEVDRLMVEMERFQRQLFLSKEERQKLYNALALKFAEAHKHSCAIMQLSKITRVSQLPA